MARNLNLWARLLYVLPMALRFLFLFAYLYGALILTAPMAALAQEPESKTGHYAERVTMAEIFGDSLSLIAKDLLPSDYEINLQIYAPPGYSASAPAGVMSFISPVESGRLPQRLESVFNERNLIWVSVNESGNEQDTYKRIFEALAASGYVRQHYATDPERRYLSGFSGGGRAASILVQFYPNWFNGVIYICGVDAPGNLPSENLEAMKQKKFVFLTGTRDFNLKETRSVFTKYKRAGFEHIKLMVVGNMRHRMPSAEKLNEAVAFLDDRSLGDGGVE